MRWLKHTFGREAPVSQETSSLTPQRFQSFQRYQRFNQLKPPQAEILLHLPYHQSPPALPLEGDGDQA